MTSEARALEQALADFLAGLEREDWVLEQHVGRWSKAAPRTAGQQQGTGWWGALRPGQAPEVVVDGAWILLEAHHALEPLGWPGSLSRLDRAVRDRWVRFPRSVVEARHPDVAPLGQLRLRLRHVTAEAAASPAPQTTAFPSARVFGKHEASRVRKWTFTDNPPRLRIDGWPGGRLVVTVGRAKIPFSVQDIDAVDASEILPGWDVVAPPPPPARFAVQEGEDDEEAPYMIRDTDLAGDLGVGHCVLAQEAVSQAVRERDAGLADRLRFDSERSEFFAYASSLEDAERLAQILRELTAND